MKPRVKYWEPAKWTALLSELKTDNKILLLRTNIQAGHEGASRRYESLQEVAFEYNFVLQRLGLVETQYELVGQHALRVTLADAQMTS